MSFQSMSGYVPGSGICWNLKLLQGRLEVSFKSCQSLRQRFMTYDEEASMEYFLGDKTFLKNLNPLCPCLCGQRVA